MNRKNLIIYKITYAKKIESKTTILINLFQEIDNLIA